MSIPSRSIPAIWIGGFFGSNGISIALGQHFSDNSFNEPITVEEDTELYFKATMTPRMAYRDASTEPDRMSGDAAGEYLWEMFVARIIKGR
ncbi:hypothetical protein AJ87_07490 [Rhizobium yanglingense]|nr:hypothetical protein AJ87_07490 [Rhizobium yanglingense]